MLETVSELVLGEMVLPVRTSIKQYQLPLKKVDPAFANKIKESQVGH